MKGVASKSLRRCRLCLCAANSSAANSKAVGSLVLPSEGMKRFPPSAFEFIFSTPVKVARIQFGKRSPRFLRKGGQFLVAIRKLCAKQVCRHRFGPNIIGALRQRASPD